MRQPEPTPSLRSLPWRAALWSLLLHGLLFAAIALVPSLHRPNERASISMRLVAVPEPAPGADMEVGHATTEPDPVRASPALDAASAEPPERLDSPDVATGDFDPTADEPIGVLRAESPSADRIARPGIAARLLEQVGQRATETAASTGSDEPSSWTGTGEPIPGLPGVRGWLSGFVGSVEPSSHRWQANDGSQRARHVLDDGTVVCAQRRAPTIDEIMNPWKSLAVTLVSVCGRQKPPPEFEDPRVQPPPRLRSHAPAGD